MSYSYQFRLKIIKLVTEQDYGKKLQRELALARAEIAYLNFFVAVMLHGVNWQCSGR